MTARWEDALDAQLDLITSMDEPTMKMYVNGWFDQEVESKRLAPSHDIAAKIRWSAMAADPVWVDPDMQTLWEAAIPTFQPEPLVPEDLIMPAGFVLFPRPHTTLDVHGRKTTYRALMWSPAKLKMPKKKMLPGMGDDSPADAKGIAIYAFHAVGDTDDYDLGGDFLHYNGPEADEERRRLSGGQVRPDEDLSLTHVLDDHVIPPSELDGTEGVTRTRIPFRNGTLTVDMLYTWEFGTSHGMERVEVQERDGKGHIYEPGSPEFEAARTKTDSIEVHVQSLWRLMQQTLATREQVRAPNNFRRRWERANLTAKPITVIRLRRPKHEPPDGQPVRHVEWRGRWIVRGFWRNQPYKSLGIHRQVWINSFVKGPPEKDLIVRKARVFELVR